MIKKKTKADPVENSSEVDWRNLLLNEAEWRIQNLAMLEKISASLEKIATAEEERNELMLDEESSSDEEDEE